MSDSSLAAILATGFKLLCLARLATDKAAAPNEAANAALAACKLVVDGTAPQAADAPMWVPAAAFAALADELDAARAALAAVDVSALQAALAASRQETERAQGECMRLVSEREAFAITVNKARDAYRVLRAERDALAAKVAAGPSAPAAAPASAPVPPPTGKAHGFLRYPASFYPGQCECCQGRFKKGADIAYWKAARRARHWACHEQALISESIAADNAAE